MTLAAESVGTDSPAWRAAEAAAAASGVRIAVVAGAADSHEVAAVLSAIWPQDNGAPPLEPNLLRALEFAGDYVSLARTRDGTPVGACVAFFGPPADRHLHSHIAGVLPAFVGRGIGRAMKLHQRAWGLDRDVRDISWTYDPVIARNAHFNLTRLGARATDHLPDFYGPMRDARNLGMRSDRMLVTWRLADDRVALLAEGDRSRSSATGVAAPALVEVVAGEPSLAADAHGLLAEHTRLVLPVPGDIERTRAERPALAARWREVVSDALRAAFVTGGWEITSFDQHSRYVLERSR